MAREIWLKKAYRPFQILANSYYFYSYWWHPLESPTGDRSPRSAADRAP